MTLLRVLLRAHALVSVALSASGSILSVNMLEATAGLEPAMEVLQTPAPCQMVRT